MKKTVAFTLVLTALILLVGWRETQVSNVMKAWSGEFSEGELKSAIKKYQRNYANIELNNGTSDVSFETDFEVSSCSVTRLSTVDDSDIDVELNGYIDTYIETKYEGSTVTIPVDWWCQTKDSWVNDYLIWSYLVRVKDTYGNSSYYYFRVDYSAYAQ